jgi:hypothetical protein
MEKLLDYAANVYSQNGEDGILEKIVENISPFVHNPERGGGGMCRIRGMGRISPI